jgi:hypothetical protein
MVNGVVRVVVSVRLVFRPWPGLARPETPLPGLFLASASAHPGGGVHGACGANAARAALVHQRLARLRRVWNGGAGARLERATPQRGSNVAALLSDDLKAEHLSHEHEGPPAMTERQSSVRLDLVACWITAEGDR